MARKPGITGDVDAKPAGGKAVSGRVPSEQSMAERKRAAEAPTIPPPPRETTKKKRDEPRKEDPKSSAVRPRKTKTTAATVDAVTADLSKDPRAESEDDE